jgi:hypothetical protein
VAKPPEWRCSRKAALDRAPLPFASSNNLLRYELRRIDELAHGRLGSFAVLARREGKLERHIRLLLPLAFLSPRIVSGLLDGTAPAGLTITALARALPWSWAEQERRLGLHCD